jgi:hypothetical protein
MQERRIFVRFDVEFPVKFIDQNTKKEGVGKIINISASGGGMIVTKESLPIETPLEMQFLIPDNKDPLQVNGKVVWSKTLKPEVYMLGIQFDKVDFMGVARALKIHK